MLVSAIKSLTADRRSIKRKQDISYVYRDTMDKYSLLHQIIDSDFKKHFLPKVLDAGGGKRDLLPDLRKELFSINISQDSFGGAEHVKHFIIADIEKIPFIDGSFDIVFCSNTLEHIVRPDVSLREIFRVTKPGGFIFIEGPIPNSIQGLVTRATPFRFHVWVYRALGVRTAGLPGKAPFPTYFAKGAHPRDILEIFQDCCKLLDASAYKSTHAKRLRNKSRILHGIYLAVSFLVYVISFGRILYSRSDFSMIFKKS